MKNLFFCKGKALKQLKLKTFSLFNKRFSRGFTLIEIMIVLGVVLILAVIAIPNMMRAKVSGNEIATIASLRALSTSCNFYAMNKNGFPPNGAAGFSALFNEVPPYINFDYSQATLQSPKDGYYYTYTYTAGANPNYSILARPSTPNLTGGRSFSVNSSSVIRYCTGSCTPNQQSPSI